MPKIDSLLDKPGFKTKMERIAGIQMKVSAILFLMMGLLLPCARAQQGGFAPATTNAVGKEPQCVIAADINGDGKMDLICANYLGTISILTNNGNGNFGSNATLTANSGNQSWWWVTAVDINGDGKLDLISASGGASTGGVGVFTNNGAGHFVPSTNYDMGKLGYLISVLPLDVNRDGKPDLVLTCLGNDFGKLHTLIVMTNNGSGLFTSNATLNVGFGPYAAVAADVNGDGKPDLVCPNYAANTVSVLTNNGAGGFVAAPTLTVQTGPVSVAASDVNGDGKVDLVVAADNGMILVMTNDGIGNLVSNAVYNVGATQISTVEAADINGDGKVDFICASSQNNCIIVFTNNGYGSFAPAGTFPVGSSPYSSPVSLAVADINGDGRPDLITANNYDNTVTVLTNIATFLPQLTITRSGTGASVSWPSQWTGWAGWRLQQNTDLSTTNWGNFGGTIFDDGTTQSVTNSMAGGNVFFRLGHP